MIRLNKDGDVEIEGLDLDEIRDLMAKAAITIIFKIKPETRDFNRMFLFCNDIGKYYYQHDRGDVIDGINTALEDLYIPLTDIVALDPLDPKDKKELDKYADKIQDYMDGSEILD
jgi:hypothetical protein